LARNKTGNLFLILLLLWGRCMGKGRQFRSSFAWDLDPLISTRTHTCWVWCTDFYLPWFPVS